MPICPKCGAAGAIATGVSQSAADQIAMLSIYCNICYEYSVIPAYSKCCTEDPCFPGLKAFLECNKERYKKTIIDVLSGTTPGNQTESGIRCMCGITQKDIIGLAGIKQKEEPTMEVSYNGFTGELFKLEKDFDDIVRSGIVYKLEIRDHEKKVTHSFTGVKLEDVKFLGGVVSFGG